VDEGVEGLAKETGREVEMGEGTREAMGEEMAGETAGETAECWIHMFLGVEEAEEPGERTTGGDGEMSPRSGLDLDQENDHHQDDTTGSHQKDDHVVEKEAERAGSINESQDQGVNQVQDRVQGHQRDQRMKIEAEAMEKTRRDDDQSPDPVVEATKNAVVVLMTPKSADEGVRHWSLMDKRIRDITAKIRMSDAKNPIGTVEGDLHLSRLRIPAATGHHRCPEKLLALHLYTATDMQQVMRNTLLVGRLQAEAKVGRHHPNQLEKNGETTMKES
jgi:hypothetical protein